MALLGSIIRRWRPPARCLLALGLAGAWPAASRAATAPVPAAEYQVKAVFLFNFAQFIDWPPEAFADAKAPLVIGMAGADPFGPYLDGLVRGEKIGEHPLVVRRFAPEDSLAGTHILFIHAADDGQTERILAAVKGRSVLTVSDAENFNRLGGMVRFATENGKIRLRVNVTAAKDEHLTISSKLLRWSTIVAPEKG